MRGTRAAVAAIMAVAAVTVTAPRAIAAANPWPHTAASGFATPTGNGFWIAYADGSVSVTGAARDYGNAAGLRLNGPIQSGAGNATGTGYWLVGYDGGVFAFGGAGFFGSMGAHRLAQPVFSMAATKTGRGYWLVARDGGIFSFGDAKFYGSMGRTRLAQPITGVTTSPTGHGYRLVAKDGGIFSFGDVPFYGSLPGIGVRATDVVGMAPTPTNRGYWIVRSTGDVYAFGDARWFGNYTSSPCDRVTGVFANPMAQGYRIMTASGATIPFGQAPAGSTVTGTQRWCQAQTTCVAALNSPSAYQAVFNTRGPVWDGADGAYSVDLLDGRRLWLFGDTYSGPAGSQLFEGFPMMRNSIAIERGNCIQFRLGGVFGSADYFPQPADGQWYWPLSAVVDRPGGVVRVAAMRIKSIDGPFGFNWTIMRAELLTLDLNSLAFRGAAPMPAPDGLLWGSSMHQDADYVYVYARGTDSRHYAARTTLAHLADGKWEFFTGSAWSTAPSAARPMLFLTAAAAFDTAPDGNVVVDRYGNGYLASTQRCDILCNTVSAWYSASAAGPWRAVNSPAGGVASTTVGTKLVTYSGHLFTSRAGFLAIWSVNRTSGVIIWNKLLYGPRVVAAQNLPSSNVLAAR